MVTMAMVCLVYPEHLLETDLGQCFLGFMAVFWLTRLMVQCFYYEKSIKREYPVYNVMFTLAFAYLGGVFSWLVL